MPLGIRVSGGKKEIPESIHSDGVPRLKEKE